MTRPSFGIQISLKLNEIKWEKSRVTSSLLLQGTAQPITADPPRLLMQCDYVVLVKAVLVMH
jgi:hypothetical protein